MAGTLFGDDGAVEAAKADEPGRDSGAGAPVVELPPPMRVTAADVAAADWEPDMPRNVDAQYIIDRLLEGGRLMPLSPELAVEREGDGDGGTS